MQKLITSVTSIIPVYTPFMYLTYVSEALNLVLFLTEV